MTTVDLIIVNFEMNTENKGGLFRTDTRPHMPVSEEDIRVVEGVAPMHLTSEDVYSGKKVTRELPAGINANSLKIVDYLPTTQRYQALPSWLKEKKETSQGE